MKVSEFQRRIEEIYFERNRTLAADEIKARLQKFQQASKKKK